MTQKPDDPRAIFRKKQQTAALKANMKKRKDAGKGSGNDETTPSPLAGDGRETPLSLDEG